ncbi:MAG: prohibitin family protein [Candidatus Competibacteraceae bacterium]|nr:prohibitin family protein [Candidatus Competibacteraceae bacterium]
MKTLTMPSEPAGSDAGQANGAVKGRSAALPRRRSWVQRSGRGALPFVSVAVLVTVLVIMYFWNTVVVVVKSGEAGALYRMFQGGTVTDYVYPEGLHILWPWNRMHIYDTRVQTAYHAFEVLTNKGLPITLKLAIRYQPEYEMVALLHQRVGPDYVQKIVVPQIESVLRRNIGKNDPEDIYTNKEGILTDIIVKAIEEAGQKFVYIDDIIIRTVELPQDIKDAIEEKLVHQQQWQAYEFRLAAERQEAERKRIEAQGISDYQETVAKTLSPDLLRWQGILATEQLAGSANAKVVVIGNGEKGLPIILGRAIAP